MAALVLLLLLLAFCSRIHSGSDAIPRRAQPTEKAAVAADTAPEAEPKGFKQWTAPYSWETTRKSAAVLGGTTIAADPDIILLENFLPVDRTEGLIRKHDQAYGSDEGFRWCFNVEELDALVQNGTLVVVNPTHSHSSLSCRC